VVRFTRSYVGEVGECEVAKVSSAVYVQLQCATTQKPVPEMLGRTGLSGLVH